jgi:RNA polymerase-binding transcription factor DksA
MDKLTDAQLRTIEQRLAHREAVLRDEVQAAKQAKAQRPSPPGQNVEDLGEAGEERFRHGMEHVDLQRDQEELVAVANARERIANGSYGVCVDCGRAIPLARLEVQPTALRDVACQEAWERTHPAAPAFTV